MTQLKLSFTDTHYKVMEDATICYLSTVLKTPGGNTSKKVFKGVARLKSGDTSDVELAKKIARAKAERAAYKAYKVIAQKVKEDYEKKIAELSGFIYNASYIVRHNSEYIQEQANSIF